MEEMFRSPELMRQVSVVEHKVCKVFDMMGKWQDFSISSGERSLITTITCMNVVGIFLPRLVVFPGQRMNAELLDGAPPRTIAA
jgi:hypothetical protein